MGAAQHQLPLEGLLMLHKVKHTWAAGLRDGGGEQPAWPPYLATSARHNSTRPSLAQNGSKVRQPLRLLGSSLTHQTEMLKQHEQSWKLVRTWAHVPGIAWDASGTCMGFKGSLNLCLSTMCWKMRLWTDHKLFASFVIPPPKCARKQWALRSISCPWKAY